MCLNNKKFYCLYILTKSKFHRRDRSVCDLVREKTPVGLVMNSIDNKCNELKVYSKLDSLKYTFKSGTTTIVSTRGWRILLATRKSTQKVTFRARSNSNHIKLVSKRHSNAKGLN